ncbi:hypothetical protein DFH28DRAFT_1126546 [Melampsora americana]|nr:hypothetical protein DFH28DRAFT_1126546 [Melampsora americana]
MDNKRPISQPQEDQPATDPTTKAQTTRPDITLDESSLSPLLVFKDRYAITSHIDQQTLPQGYQISIYDSRLNFIEYKCYEGRYQSQSKPGTCPYYAKATRTLDSEEEHWTLQILVAHHDHPSSNQPLTPRLNLSLPPPPPGVFSNSKELMSALDKHSIPNGYSISILDSRPTYLDLKCCKGRTRRQKTRGTCPFYAQATRASEDGPCTLKIYEPRHDHVFINKPPSHRRRSEPKSKPLVSESPPPSKPNQPSKPPSLSDPAQPNPPGIVPTLSQTFELFLARTQKLDTVTQLSIVETFDHELTLAEMNNVTAEHLNASKRKIDDHDDEFPTKPKCKSPRVNTPTSDPTAQVVFFTAKEGPSGMLPEINPTLSAPSPSPVHTKRFISQVDCTLLPAPSVKSPSPIDIQTTSLISPMQNKTASPIQSMESLSPIPDNPPLLDPLQTLPISSPPSFKIDLHDPPPKSHHTPITNDQPMSIESPVEQPPIPPKKSSISTKVKKPPKGAQPAAPPARSSARLKGKSKTLPDNLPSAAVHPVPSKATKSKEEPQPLTNNVTTKHPKAKPASSRTKEAKPNSNHAPPSAPIVNSTGERKRTLRSGSGVSQSIPTPNDCPEAPATKQNEDEKDEITPTCNPPEHPIPCMEEIPSYLHPFVISVTDVTGEGLCAFASIAVSLGRSEQEAPIIRKEMEAELLSRYDWYKDHIPTLCVDYTIERFLEILQNPLETAPPTLYYPMPGGTTLIANTYNQPVIYYSKLDTATLYTRPFFTPPPVLIKPIIIAFVRTNHYVSVDLTLSPSLPIPFLNQDWNHLHEETSEGWTGLYDDNCAIFAKLSKQLRKARYKENDETRLRLGLGEPVYLSLEDGSNDGLNSSDSDSSDSDSSDSDSSDLSDTSDTKT